MIVMASNNNKLITMLSFIIAFHFLFIIGIIINR